MDYAKYQDIGESPKACLDYIAHGYEKLPIRLCAAVAFVIKRDDTHSTATVALLADLLRKRL